jgi:hypothetical protein
MPAKHQPSNFLIKKDPNTLVELKDLTLHMKRVATGIKGNHYKPNDAEFSDFATNLFKLAVDIETFMRRKANLP